MSNALEVDVDALSDILHSMNFKEEETNKQWVGLVVASDNLTPDLGCTPTNSVTDANKSVMSLFLLAVTVVSLATRGRGGRSRRCRR